MPRKWHRRDERYMYCAVTADEYELIKYWAMGLRELAEQIGITREYACRCRSRGDTVRGMKIIKIDLWEEEENVAG